MGTPIPRVPNAMYPLDLRGLLRRYNLHPKKRLGQNFLADETALEKVAAAAELQPTDTVLEIGAGAGYQAAILSELVKRVHTVDIIEELALGAERRLRSHRIAAPLLVFRNDGGSARIAKTIAGKTYSSGPRGGLEGVRALARHYGFQEVVSVDVGGTTIAAISQRTIGWICARSPRPARTRLPSAIDVLLTFEFQNHRRYGSASSCT